jgi:16S rRNA (guanine1207-N2)-methyltransferase
MQAPAGTLERRFALAEALTALCPGGVLVAIAPKDKGGARLRKELEAFGSKVAETSKSHHRICEAVRPETLLGVEAARAAGALHRVEPIGLWSQAGIFSWDRTDPGSSLLASRLPPLKGAGADLGCGLGFLALSVLKAPSVQVLHLVDKDRRAIAAARANVQDPRAQFHWADVTQNTLALGKLDFIAMNPPFHSGGLEDKALGQAFIRKAASMLRTGGTCWLVANRHLPYEAALTEAFAAVRLDHEAAGFKVLEAKA